MCTANTRLTAILEGGPVHSSKKEDFSRSQDAPTFESENQKMLKCVLHQDEENNRGVFLVWTSFSRGQCVYVSHFQDVKIFQHPLTRGLRICPPFSLNNHSLGLFIGHYKSKFMTLALANWDQAATSSCVPGSDNNTIFQRG